MTLLVKLQNVYKLLSSKFLKPIKKLEILKSWLTIPKQMPDNHPKNITGQSQKKKPNNFLFCSLSGMFSWTYLRSQKNMTENLKNRKLKISWMIIGHLFLRLSLTFLGSSGIFFGMVRKFFGISQLFWGY